jgi:CheY-like chemotaxis protein
MTNVLLIEDSKQSARYLGMVIEKNAKMSLDTAPTASIALSMLKENRYDYILCDIELPEMNGPDILLSSPTHNAKIFFCSASDDIEERIKPCLNGKLNVVGYRTKPIFKKDLMEIFQNG